MTSKRYMKNPQFFDRNGRRIPGVISSKIHVTIEEEDPAKKDRENRKQVVDTIINALADSENKFSLEELAEQLANDDEIRRKFTYIRSDLAKVFISWYNGRIRPKTDFEKNIR